jgi:hypothetical protein
MATDVMVDRGGSRKPAGRTATSGVAHQGVVLSRAPLALTHSEKRGFPPTAAALTLETGVPGR